MKLNIFSTKELAIKTAEALNKRLAQSKDMPYLLLLSGGSSFALLEYIDTTLIGNNTTIAVTDERYSTDKNENNFCLLMENKFYTIAKQNGAKFINTAVKSNETLEDHSERFFHELKKWRNKNPTAPIYATIGVGPDGHIAGIMPYPDDTSLFYKLFQNDRWVVGYNAGTKNPFSLRSTITISFIIEQISFAVSYISGENKRRALEKILAKNGTLPETPALVLNNMKDVEIFTDISISKSSNK